MYCPLKFHHKELIKKFSYLRLSLRLSLRPLFNNMKLTYLAVITYILLAISSSLANEEVLHDSVAEENFKQGQILYENNKFEAAADKFLKAISLSSNDSRYHHWLAKTYGELAEISGWLEAINLAKDSRESLEHAIELDANNIAALTDLAKYYKQAPIFLGGNNRKAAELNERIEKLNKEKQPVTK